MIEMDAMISTLQFVLRSDWVAILSGLICIADIGRETERVISPIYDPPLIAEFVVISPARRTLSTQAQLFLEALRGRDRAHPGRLGADHPAGGLSGAAAARAARLTLHRRRRAGLLQRMRPRERLVLHAGVGDALEGRERREIDLEEARARRLAGEADVGDGDAVAVGVFAGRLVLQMGLERGQRGAVPVLRPFRDGGLVDLEFMRRDIRAPAARSADASRRRRSAPAPAPARGPSGPSAAAADWGGSRRDIR